MTDVLAQRQEANLAGLAEEINLEHRAFLGSLSKTAEHGIRCGELLAEAKNQCKHGEWLPWVRQNFDGSERSAQVYMQMFRNRDEIRAKTQGSADLSIAGALKEISTSREDSEAPTAEAAEDSEAPSMSREELERATERIKESLAKIKEAERGYKESDEASRYHIDKLVEGGADREARAIVREKAFSELGLATGAANMAILGARCELKDYLDVLASSRSSGSAAIRERVDARLRRLEPLASEERGLLKQFYPEELAKVDAAQPRVEFFYYVLERLNDLVTPVDMPEFYRSEGLKKLTDEQASTAIAKLLEAGAVEEKDVYRFERWPHPLLWIGWPSEEEDEAKDWQPSEWWLEKARALARDKTAK